jgi:hypothetical protein
MVDFDNEVQFWIKDIPYIWIPRTSIYTSQRLYIFHPKDTIIVFDKNNKFYNLSRVNSDDNIECISMLPFSESCNFIRQYFQVYPLSLINFSDHDIRIEGNPTDLKKNIITSENTLKIVSTLYKKNVKIYRELLSNLNMYGSIIYRNKLYYDVVDKIFDDKKIFQPFETYDAIKEKGLPYFTEKNLLKYTLHRGQCKLFLSELQFLTNQLTKHTDTDIVIYPGGCPANHLWYLIQFFPNLKFISIDPTVCELYVEKKGNIHYKQHIWNSYAYLKTNKEFKNKNIQKFQYKKILGNGDPEHFVEYINKTNFRVYFIQDILTIPLAHNLKKLKNSLYISDIRTEIAERGKPHDIDIIWNLSQQYNWISILKPKAYMLKFVLPFREKEMIIKDDLKNINPMFLKVVKEDFAYSKKLGIDFLKDYKNNTLNYLDGIVNIQTAQGVSSSETRLVGTNMNIKNYGTSSEYENKFVYYNLIRSLGFFENPLANKKLGFDHCGDCSLEYKIWKNYADKYNKKVTLNWVEGLINITGQGLIKGRHGRKFTHLSWPIYKELYENIQIRKRY